MSAKETLRLVATIIKSFIGSGVLFLPKAFANGGFAFSIGSMMFMAFLSTLCILRLVHCKTWVKGSYGTVGKAAVGRWGQIAVDVSLVLSQAGFGCVYIVFIARNVLQLLNANSCWLDARWLWVLVLLEWPLFTPLTWVRNIASFGPTNIAADVLIALGLAAVLAWSASGMRGLSGDIGWTPFNSASAPLMLGTAVYAFEGVGMVVPVYDSLSKPAQSRFTFILSWTLLGVACVYITMGVVPYAYMAWAGIHIQDAVTLNLPKEGWAFAVIVGYCIALTFSYPLMLFPAIVIVEKAAAPYLGLVSGGGRQGASKGHKDSGAEAAEEGLGDEDVRMLDKGADSEQEEEEYTVPLVESRRDMLVRNAFRGFVVAVTLAVAYGGSSQLDNFVSLIGCFCCTPLAFIYPMLFHVRLNKEAGLASRAVDWSVLLFGVGIFIFSTYQAISTWSVSVIDPCPYSAPSA